MFAGTSHFLLWTHLITITCSQFSASVDQKIITALSGENVTLTCRAQNKIIAVEWNRADLDNEQYVLLYRDDRFDPEYQHRSFKNRVDLQDRQMKDGDVSLILKNVTSGDSGTYECHVLQSETNRKKRSVYDTRSWKSICIIYLVVDPPGQTGGHTEDGGKEAGRKKDGGKEAGGKLLRKLLTVAAKVMKLLLMVARGSQLFGELLVLVARGSQLFGELLVLVARGSQLSMVVAKVIELLKVVARGIELLRDLVEVMFDLLELVF